MNRTCSSMLALGAVSGFLKRQVRSQTCRIAAILLFLIFPISPLYSQSIIVISDLQFPNTESMSGSQDIVINPGDSEAAVFDAVGTPNLSVDVSIKEKKVQIQNASGTKITVESFTFGGSLTPSGQGAVGTFNSSGNLNNMRIGATASVKNNQNEGTYTGTLTLQVTYQ